MSTLKQPPSPVRLYLDAPLSEGGEAALDEAQAHYLKNVMRRGAGDAVCVFNARDGEFEGAIEALSKKSAVIRLQKKIRAPEPEPDLWLIFAAVKRGAVDMIAEKATELGVAALMPVTTERTNAARVNEARLAAIAREAAEQCGRLSVPRVDPLAPLAKVLDAWPQDRRLIFCDEAGDDRQAEWGGRQGRAAPMLEALGEDAQTKWAILIGPEGGFSPAERLRLRESDFVTPMTLGPRILRADTAAISAIALWQAARGDFRRR
ncbi:MAG TPA: 16S rRNA (uracil(1498)-N(3))-methyltransferase [Parvularculaceae bacterium]|nr:16S rRNA (uracil(1498)-N(3))-methyltransferase [Parvularculaceae bacterium]